MTYSDDLKANQRAEEGVNERVEERANKPEYSVHTVSELTDTLKDFPVVPDINKSNLDSKNTISVKGDSVDFWEIYNQEYRKDYWENIKSKTIDDIINNDIEENIDALLKKKLNLDPKSEDYVLKDLVKCYPELENTYERVHMQYYLSALREMNIEYFVCQWLVKYPELRRNDIRFKEYLPRTRLREIKSQYFTNVLIDKYPELWSTSDRFKDYESSGRLKEIYAQNKINDWIKKYPEFQRIIDSKKDLQPSILVKFMKFNNA